MDQTILKNQVHNPSSNVQDILENWEKCCAVPYRLAIGFEVKILFLKSKNELNGKIGKIVGWKEERCIVKVEGNDALYTIRRGNLLPNGFMDKKSGKIIIEPLTEDRVQYLLEDGDGRQAIVNIDNLEFIVGTPVVLRNLNLTKWNGECGVIQSEMEEGKYLVNMNSRKTLKIQHEKLFV